MDNTNKTLTIARNGQTASIIVRQMVHDTQYKIGSKIKWGSGKQWTVTEISQNKA